MTNEQIDQLIADLTPIELTCLQIALQECFVIPCWWSAEDLDLSAKEFASFREWCHAGIDLEEDEFKETLLADWECDDDWIEPLDEGEQIQ